MLEMVIMCSAYTCRRFSVDIGELLSLLLVVDSHAALGLGLIEVSEGLVDLLLGLTAVVSELPEVLLDELLVVLVSAELVADDEEHGDQEEDAQS